MSNPPDPPSPTDDNGRDDGGRFTPGNKFAKGNPHARRIQEIRAALMEAVTPEAVKIAALALVEQAKAGDRFAFSEMLDRTLGKPTTADVVERLEALEQAFADLADRRAR